MTACLPHELRHIANWSDCAGVQLLGALALRARPSLHDLCLPPGALEDEAISTEVFNAPDEASTSIPWSSVWSHLLHDSAVLAPSMQLLSQPGCTDVSLRAAGLTLLLAVAGLPFEFELLQEACWSTRLTGVSIAFVACTSCILLVCLLSRRRQCSCCIPAVDSATLLLQLLQCQLVDQLAAVFS